jgi:hypothetical protein
MLRRKEIAFLFLFLATSGLALIAGGCGSQRDFAGRREDAKVDSKQVLLSSDLDPTCGNVKNPGLVEADFDGNGIADEAMILKVGAEKQVRLPDDSESKGFFAEITVRLKQKGGEAAEIVLERFDHAFPANIALTPFDKRVASEFDSDKKVSLENPGFVLNYCERSACLYYFDIASKSFKKLWISD